MERIRKIDIHAHAAPFQMYSPIVRGGIPWVSPEELIAHYDALDIEKGVLLPLNSPEYHFEQFTSGDCKYISDKYPDRFLWFCGIDPRGAGNLPNSDISLLLKHYKNLGAKGMGELTAQLYADDPMMENLFFHCAENNMPVTIHIAPCFGGLYGIVDELGLPRIEKILAKYTKLKILGHSQPFWAEIGADASEANRNGYPTGKVVEGRLVELMRKYNNLYCDCSAGSGGNAFMRDEDFAERFIAEFSDRILYGCDICHNTNTHQYTFNDFLNRMRGDKRISEDNYYKLVRGNAIKLLKLDIDE